MICERALIFHVKSAIKGLIVAEHHLTELFKKIINVTADEPETAGLFTSLIALTLNDITTNIKELEELLKTIEKSKLMEKARAIEEKEREIPCKCNEPSGAQTT